MTWQRQSENDDCWTNAIDVTDFLNGQSNVMHLKSQVGKNDSKPWTKQ
jgi:hypothetical protein